MLNTYDAYNAIAAKVAAGSKDYTDEIAMVQTLIDQEHEIIVNTLTSGSSLLNSAADILGTVDFDTVIAKENAFLS